jgi:hypothetical protein
MVREITSHRNQARRLRPTRRTAKRSASLPRGERASANTRAFNGRKRSRKRATLRRCPIEWTPNEEQLLLVVGIEGWAEASGAADGDGMVQLLEDDLEHSADLLGVSIVVRAVDDC